jgi:hypothetical protein
VHPEVREVVERMHDDVLDAVARLWYRGKGKEPPPEPGAGGSKIEIEGWCPGDLVDWDAAHACLRGDTYVFGDRVFEAMELYCVEPDCDCSEVVVAFYAIVPRGAPHPGHVEFDGAAATQHPDHERQHEQLAELWQAYCERHPGYAARFRQRSGEMHGLAGRVVAAHPPPRVGRNEPCPCGSGNKFKKCCGAI